MPKVSGPSTALVFLGLAMVAVLLAGCGADPDNERPEAVARTPIPSDAFCRTAWSGAWPTPAGESVASRTTGLPQFPGALEVDGWISNRGPDEFAVQEFVTEADLADVLGFYESFAAANGWRLVGRGSGANGTILQFATMENHYFAVSQQFWSRAPFAAAPPATLETEASPEPACLSRFWVETGELPTQPLTGTGP